MFPYKINDHITLRLVTENDGEALFSLVTKERQHLRKWLPWVDSATLSTYSELIPIWIKQYEEKAGLQAAILYDNVIIGMIGLHSIQWQNSQTSIGYWLSERYEGKGIMTKCAEALLHYSFHENGLERVEIRCGQGNVKSNRIPIKLGFTHEGTARHAEFLYDHYHDLEVYSLLHEEWKSLYREKTPL
jgi:ribosomal-protein-serine acetyltransferase